MLGYAPFDAGGTGFGVARRTFTLHLTLLGWFYYLNYRNKFFDKTINPLNSPTCLGLPASNWRERCLIEKLEQVEIKPFQVVPSLEYPTLFTGWLLTYPLSPIETVTKSTTNAAVYFTGLAIDL